MVGDDETINGMVALALTRAAFFVSSCRTLTDARRALTRERYGLVVVDPELPDGDGLGLVSEVSSTSPVIVVAGRRSFTDDGVRAFQAGADDYVVEPFSPREFVARITAVLRRSEPSRWFDDEPNHLVYDDLQIDLRGRQLWVRGALTPINRKEFDLLVALASHPRRACSRKELLEWVWKLEPDRAASATLTEHVRRVRVRLGEHAEHPRHIVTVRHVGYRFDP